MPNPNYRGYNQITLEDARGLLLADSAVKSAWLSVRVTPELRQRVGKLARERGLNVGELLSALALREVSVVQMPTGGKPPTPGEPSPRRRPRTVKRSKPKF